MAVVLGRGHVNEGAWSPRSLRAGQRRALREGRGLRAYANEGAWFTWLSPARGVDMLMRGVVSIRLSLTPFPRPAAVGVSRPALPRCVPRPRPLPRPRRSWPRSWSPRRCCCCCWGRPGRLRTPGSRIPPRGDRKLRPRTVSTSATPWMETTPPLPAHRSRPDRSQRNLSLQETTSAWRTRPTPEAREAELALKGRSRKRKGRPRAWSRAWSPRWSPPWPGQCRASWPIRRSACASGRAAPPPCSRPMLPWPLTSPWPRPLQPLLLLQPEGPGGRSSTYANQAGGAFASLHRALRDGRGQAPLICITRCHLFPIREELNGPAPESASHLHNSAPLVLGWGRFA